MSFADRIGLAHPAAPDEPTAAKARAAHGSRPRWRWPGRAGTAWYHPQGMRTTYDVFVSHNGLDTPLIERLCLALQAARMQPWFDEWALMPGDEWIREIERVLDTVPVVLVCVEAHGFEPWQDAQRQVALERAISVGKSTVVPVLLPGAPEKVELPGFLRGRQWLDLRAEAGWGRGIERLAAVVERRRLEASGGGGAAAAEGVRPERADAPAQGVGDVGDETLIAELARVLWDSDHAILAARNAGFPVQNMPPFKTAALFWKNVVDAARGGAVPGGVKAVANAAGKLFPGNLVFVRYRAR
jgi:hypothetical protein